MSEDNKRPVGRPSKFNDLIFGKIIELAKAGKTNRQIAEIVGIHESTICDWQNVNPEFLFSIKEAKQQADEMVEAALFKRATGYSHPAVKIMQAGGEVIKEEYTESYPPDPTAAIFWLKNRRPAEWRDKQELEHSGGVTVSEVVEMFKIEHDQNEKDPGPK